MGIALAPLIVSFRRLLHRGYQFRMMGQMCGWVWAGMLIVYCKTRAMYIEWIRARARVVLELMA